jgi:hypothetical protein
MPRGDRSGPMGMGPKTGRGAGFCAGFDSPGYENPTPQYGMGWGGGGRRRRQRGRGFGPQFAGGPANWTQPGIGQQTAPLPQTDDRDDEKQNLQDQAQSLQALLGAINERLERLERQRDQNAG